MHFIKINKQTDSDFFDQPIPEIADEDAIDSDVQWLMDELVAKNIPQSFFKHPETYPIMASLKRKGADSSHFLAAYSAALHAAQKKGSVFGLPYLAKVVDDLLNKKNHQHWVKPDVTSKPKKQKEPEEVQYKHNFDGGLDWMGHLLAGEEW